MIRRMGFVCALLIALTGVGGSAVAVNPALAVAVDVDALANPALDQRARAVSRQLRCLVCQNQSIEDSNADLARDLRQLVRERLTAGDSDDQAIAYIVARYGDWVLLNPPVNERTYVLWVAPLVIAGLGLFVVLWRGRQRMGPAPVQVALSPDEAQRLAEITRRKN